MGGLSMFFIVSLMERPSSPTVKAHRMFAGRPMEGSPFSIAEFMNHRCSLLSILNFVPFIFIIIKTKQKT